MYRMKSCDFHNKLLKISSVMLISLFVNQALAIQAVTINPIHGRAPVISDFDKVKNKIGLQSGTEIFNKDTFPDGKLPLDGSLIPGSLSAGLAPLAQGDVSVTDEDGDTVILDENGNPVVGFELISPGGLSWKKNGQEIPADDLASKSLCDLSGDGQITVMMSGYLTSATNAGLPSVGVTADFSQEYAIDPSCGGSGRIRSLKPRDSKTDFGMPVENGFVVGEGFPLDSMSNSGKRKFPSVAFKYASFDVVMEDDSDYVIDVDLPNLASTQKKDGVIKVDGTNITFLDEYLGEGTINIKNKQGKVLDTYDFTILDWFVPSGAVGLDSCTWSPTSGGQKNCEEKCDAFVSHYGESFKVPISRAMTNAKYENISMREKSHRGISTLIGEWGELKNYDGVGGGAQNVYFSLNYISSELMGLQRMAVHLGSGTRIGVPSAVGGTKLICWIGPRNDPDRPAPVSN